MIKDAIANFSRRSAPNERPESGPVERPQQSLFNLARTCCATLHTCFVDRKHRSASNPGRFTVHNPFLPLEHTIGRKTHHGRMAFRTTNHLACSAVRRAKHWTLEFMFVRTAFRERIWTSAYRSIQNVNAVL